jgi:hypothetical protein
MVLHKVQLIMLVLMCVYVLHFVCIVHFHWYVVAMLVMCTYVLQKCCKPGRHSDQSHSLTCCQMLPSWNVYFNLCPLLFSMQILWGNAVCHKKKTAENIKIEKPKRETKKMLNRTINSKRKNGKEKVEVYLMGWPRPSYQPLGLGVCGTPYVSTRSAYSSSLTMALGIYCWDLGFVSSVAHVWHLILSSGLLYYGVSGSS